MSRDKRQKIIDALEQGLHQTAGDIADQIGSTPHYVNQVIRESEFAKYRKIKPEKISLGASNHVWVTDFANEVNVSFGKALDAIVTDARKGGCNLEFTQEGKARVNGAAPDLQSVEWAWVPGSELEYEPF